LNRTGASKLSGANASRQTLVDTAGLDAHASQKARIVPKSITARCACTVFPDVLVCCGRVNSFCLFLRRENADDNATLK